MAPMTEPRAIGYLGVGVLTSSSGFNLVGGPRFLTRRFCRMEAQPPSFGFICAAA